MKHTPNARVQTLVEQPMIYLIALNSSSIEDQAGIIPDRVECLSEPILSSSGIKINDTLKFFTGDHTSHACNSKGACKFKCGGCMDAKRHLWMTKHMH